SSIACVAGLARAATRKPGLPTFSLIFEKGSSMDEKPFIDAQGHGHLHELADAGRWMELWRELRGASNTYGDGMLGMYFKFLTVYGPAWRIAKLRGMANRVLGRLRRRRRPAPRG
ncbi:MAG: hypothetical protein E5W21_36635, partial [Mesorhizobium sp.]